MVGTVQRDEKDKTLYSGTHEPGIAKVTAWTKTEGSPGMNNAVRMRALSKRNKNAREALLPGDYFTLRPGVMGGLQNWLFLGGDKYFAHGLGANYPDWGSSNIGPMTEKIKKNLSSIRMFTDPEHFHRLLQSAPAEKQAVKKKEKQK